MHWKGLFPLWIISYLRHHLHLHQHPRGSIKRRINTSLRYTQYMLPMRRTWPLCTWQLCLDSRLLKIPQKQGHLVLSTEVLCFAGLYRALRGPLHEPKCTKCLEIMGREILWVIQMGGKKRSAVKRFPQLYIPTLNKRTFRLRWATLGSENKRSRTVWPQHLYKTSQKLKKIL